MMRLLLIINMLFLFTLPLNTLNAKGSFADDIGLVGTKANNFNGAVAETYINTYMQSNGFGKIDGEVGRNGIDGLFYKKVDGKMEVTIIESKHGVNAELGSSKNGKQMSKEWKLNAVRNKMKQLTKKLPDKKVQKILDDLSEVEEVIKNGKDKSRLFKMIPLTQEYNKLKKSSNLDSLQKNRLGYLENLNRKNKLSSSFRTNIQEIDNDGELITTKELKTSGVHNKEIDLQGTYKKGTKELKQQKILEHSIRKQKRILIETEKLYDLKQTQKTLPKDSPQYKELTKSIEKQTKFIKKIKKSRPKGLINIKSTEVQKKGFSALVFKKDKKVVVFMNSSILKHLKIKNIAKGSVVMVIIDGGSAIYSVLDGGITYKNVSRLLIDGEKTVAIQGFSKVLVFATPPPAGMFLVASIAGAIIIDYAIDKYIELDKRNYVRLEDMLWAVPDEVKNKITALNVEDLHRGSIYDYNEADKDTVLVIEKDGESVFDYGNDKETILEY